MSHKYYNSGHDGRDGFRLLKDKDANSIPCSPSNPRGVTHIPMHDLDDDVRLSLGVLPARRIKMALKEMNMRRIGKVLEGQGNSRVFINATDDELVQIIQGKL